MHFSKLCDIFRRKAIIAGTTEPANRGRDNVIQADEVSLRGDEDVVQVQSADKPLPSLPNDQGQSVGSTNVDCSAPRRSLHDQTSYIPLFWPNSDRAPSMMHFYVPSRSSASSPASSSTTIPQDPFRDYSQTFDDDDISSPDLRPGAISRLDSPRRDSKLHGSITIQCHPAILDNPPPFERWSSPPKVRASVHPAQRQATENNDLRRQASMLEIQSDHLTTRLEQTCQDLENMTCTRDVTRQMLKECNEIRLQAEDCCRAWSRKYRQMYSGLESVLRANNAMEQELRGLERDHATCKSREAQLQDRIDTLLASRWRGNGWLKRRLMETNDRNNILVGAHEQQTEALDVVKKRNVTLERKVEEAKQKMAIMEEQLILANESREEDTEALQLAEREVYQLSERLRVAETAIRDKSANLEHATQQKERLASLLRLTRE